MKEGDTVKFRNGGEGVIVKHLSGNLGINILPYMTMCEPLSNYDGLKHKFLQGLDIVSRTRVFKITLGAEFSPNSVQYKILTKPQEVREPKNWYHKLRKRLGLNYKEAIVGWEYNVEKV